MCLEKASLGNKFVLFVPWKGWLCSCAGKLLNYQTDKQTRTNIMCRHVLEDCGGAEHLRVSLGIKEFLKRFRANGNSSAQAYSAYLNGLPQRPGHGRQESGQERVSRQRSGPQGATGGLAGSLGQLGIISFDFCLHLLFLCWIFFPLVC